MNLRHLAVFHAVAETGSLSKAAERLYITQPAVSRQLKALEDALGLALLDREPRGVRLTEAGLVLHDYASRIFALSARARASMEEICNLKSGRLSLGASTTIGNYLLPAVLAQFRALYPTMDIRLEISNTDTIQRLLLEDRIDLGFTEGFAEHQELDGCVFMHDELAIIAPAGHPLTGEGHSADISTLCRHAWVMREPGSGTQAVLESILRTNGCSEPRAVFTLGSTEAVKGAVLAGAGIAGVSYLTVINEIRAGTLVRIPCRDVIFQRPLHQLRHRNRQTGPVVDAFLEMLSRVIDTKNLLPLPFQPVAAPA
jgi:DNA-binding transcriptional LysR family regulator